MPNASHKHAGTTITIASNLPVTALRHLAETTAVAVEATGLHKGSKHRIHLEDRDGDTTHFWVGNNRAIITFAITTTATDTGSYLTSTITWFQTLQDKLLIFIPAGPKQLIGWNWYLNFMLNLQDAVLNVDIDADISLTEAAG